MLIDYRQPCHLDHGTGIRYLISISKEDSEDVYNIKIKDLLSDISKYPWLKGITVIGYIDIENNELLELLLSLPKHLDTCIELDISQIKYNSIDELQQEIDKYKNSEIGRSVGLTIFINKEVE